jgi:hypothetical protein
MNVNPNEDAWTADSEAAETNEHNNRDLEMTEALARARSLRDRARRLYEETCRWGGLTPPVVH